MTHTYYEYGAILSDGPHKGMVIKSFHSLDGAERWVADPPRGQEGPYAIFRREVTKGNWSLVPEYDDNDDAFVERGL